MQTTEQKTRHFIGVISKEYAQMAMEKGLVSVCHGKKGPLQRMEKGDQFVIYSHKFTIDGKEPLQAFTGIGEVVDEEIYQMDWDGFSPFVRKMKFIKTKEASIRPLLDTLSFTKGKKNWGFKFMTGFFEIEKQDFELIKSKMA